MKSIYTNPDVEIAKIYTEDILTTSPEEPTPGTTTSKPDVDVGLDDEGGF